MLRVIDGDTLIVEPKERVRLIGVDAPESVAPARPVEVHGPRGVSVPVGAPPDGHSSRLETFYERFEAYRATLRP